MDDASIRVSDADREQAVVSLREHLLAGRLTLDEFSERVEAALRARVGGELARLQEDLPAVSPAVSRSRRKPSRFTAALLGHVARDDRDAVRGDARPLQVEVAPPPLDVGDALLGGGTRRAPQARLAQLSR